MFYHGVYEPLRPGRETAFTLERDNPRERGNPRERTLVLAALPLTGAAAGAVAAAGLGAAGWRRRRAHTRRTPPTVPQPSSLS